LNKKSTNASPFDDPLPPAKGEVIIHAPGPGQFTLRVIALITFDVAFVLGWWANATSHSPLGEEMGEYANRVIGSTLRVGIVAYPFWAFVVGFLPALAGAALGSCAHADAEHRRHVRGASMFWTLISGVIIESLVRLGLYLHDPGSDAKMLMFAFGNLGWGGLVLIVYLAWLAMIGAGYGFVIALILSLLGRWKMIPLAAP
jgi:hypothetical protein